MKRDSTALFTLTFPDGSVVRSFELWTSRKFGDSYSKYFPGHEQECNNLVQFKVREVKELGIIVETQQPPA